LLPLGYRVLCSTYLDERTEMMSYGFSPSDGDWLSVVLTSPHHAVHPIGPYKGI